MATVIGITGGIASGKSTVTQYLVEKGYVVLDSDRFSKEALTIDTQCIQKVKDNFGCVVDGKIDRKKLGHIIFHDAKAKQTLEEIIHPYVIQKLKEGIEEHQHHHIVFLDIPLLYECSLQYLCDTIVVVYCDKEVQISRLIQRDGITKRYAETILDNQLPLSKKRELADICIDNSFTYKALYEQLEKRW